MLNCARRLQRPPSRTVFDQFIANEIRHLQIRVLSRLSQPPRRIALTRRMSAVRSRQHPPNSTSYVTHGSLCPFFVHYFWVLGQTSPLPRWLPGRPLSPLAADLEAPRCGTAGGNFFGSFRYLDQLGRLARRGVAVVFHNTLASSEYGLLDQKSFEPRPNYWAALLWCRLMGTTVLNAARSEAGLHLYAHCLKEHPGGVALLAINISRTQPRSINLPMAGDRYSLAAETLESPSVKLNGQTLHLGRNDELPPLRGATVKAGVSTLQPATITFLTFELISAADGYRRNQAHEHATGQLFRFCAEEPR